MEEPKAEEKLPAPPRNVAFENFKKGKGAESSKVLVDNKGMNSTYLTDTLELLREKKKLSKELAIKVNTTKQDIDNLRNLIDKKKQDRAFKGRNNELSQLQAENQNEDSEVIDDEEFQYVKQIKDLKQVYREAYDALKGMKSEIEFITK